MTENEKCSTCAISKAFHDVAVAERDYERGKSLSNAIEIERLRNALAQISLMEYESTSSASEKVHAAARISRAALRAEK